MDDLSKYTDYSDDLDAWNSTYSGIHEYGYHSDNDNDN